MRRKSPWHSSQVVFFSGSCEGKHSGRLLELVRDNPDVWLNFISVSSCILEEFTSETCQTKLKEQLPTLYRGSQLPEKKLAKNHCCWSLATIFQRGTFLCTLPVGTSFWCWMNCDETVTSVAKGSALTFENKLLHFKPPLKSYLQVSITVTSDW